MRNNNLNQGSAEITNGLRLSVQNKFKPKSLLSLLVWVNLAACIAESPHSPSGTLIVPRNSDAATSDANSVNTDAGVIGLDTFIPDARSIDTGIIIDATVPDAGFLDAEPMDAEPIDAGTPPPAIPPDQTGDSTWNTASETITRGNRTIPVETYLPNGAVNAPLIVFIPGFQLDSRRYGPLMEHLSSHGFVVLRTDPPDPLLTVSHTEMSADVSAVLDWALDSQRSFSNQIDATKIAAMGHSLGGKVATMVAHADNRVTALLGLDPVNGEHPQNGYTSAIPNILPDEISNLAIPIGLMGETTDDGSAGGGMACAPAAANFTHFYDAAQAANWLAEWDIAGADHMDFVNDTSLCFSCGFCQNGAADKNDVLLTVRTLSAAFFRYHFKNDLALLPWLLGAELDASVTLRSRP